MYLNYINLVILVILFFYPNAKSAENIFLYKGTFSRTIKIEELNKFNETRKASTKLKNEASTALMYRLGNHSSGIGESLKIYWGNSPAKKAYSVDAREESRSKSIKVELINE